MGIFDFLKKNKNIENDNGLNETYYINGKGGLRESFHKKDGVINGKYIELEMCKTDFGRYVESNRNGMVKQIGEYKNGKKEGVWFYNGEDGLTDYDLTGSRRWVVTYKNGILHGKFKVYLTFMDIENNNNTPLIKRNEHTHLLDEEEGITINDTNIECLVEEGECVEGVKHGEWKIYELEMKNSGDGVFKTKKPTGNIKETYTTIWEKGNIKVESTTQYNKERRIFKGYKKSFEPEYQHPCQESKTPLIYINSIKDNNDVNIIDCFGNNVKDNSEGELNKSFINREIP
jgi:hypothetical protein